MLPDLHRGNCLKVLPKLPKGYDLVVADPPAEMAEEDVVEALRLCRLRCNPEADLLLYGVNLDTLKWLAHKSLWNIWSSIPIYTGPELVGHVVVGHKLQSAFPYSPQALYVSPKGLSGHPTAKARDWYEYLIRPYGYRNVLDPFAGLGAVGEICRDTGAHYTGIELDAQVFKQLKQRLA